MSLMSFDDLKTRRVMARARLAVLVTHPTGRMALELALPNMQVIEDIETVLQDLTEKYTRRPTGQAEKGG